MSAHAYTEEKLVEQPAMRLFAELDWKVAQSRPYLGSLPESSLFHNELPGGETPPFTTGGTPATTDGEFTGRVESPAWVDESGLFGRETKGEVVLVALSRSLSEEQQRHVREHLTEEELAVFDILMRPAPELSTEEKAEVKRVTRELLERLKTLLALDWRKRGAARAQVRLAIEDTLDPGLPRAFTPDLYQQKCTAVFQHVYESYPERDSGVYAERC